MASGDHQSGDTWVARVNALLDDVTQTIERLAMHISETFRHTDPDAENRRSSSSRQTSKNDSRPDGEPPNRVAPPSAGNRSPSTAVTDADKARPPLERL
jgi:hypothetical protein